MTDSKQTPLTDAVVEWMKHDVRGVFNGRASEMVSAEFCRDFEKRIAALEAERAELIAEATALREQKQDMWERMTAAEQRAEGLEKDAERWRFRQQLFKNGGTLIYSANGKTMVRYGPGKSSDFYDTETEAIDAAIAGRGE